MMIILLSILSTIIIFHCSLVNAKVYTDEDLEPYKNNSSSYQPTGDLNENSQIPEDHKTKRKKTKTKFSARGCEVVKFSPYNQTTSSKVRSKGRLIQGEKVIDLDENIIVNKKTKRCSSFTIRNTSYTYKVSPIIKATSTNGQIETKRITIPKLNQNKTHAAKLCFEELKAPIVKIECSF